MLQELPGVPKIKEGFNPATWMLDATSAAVELQLQVDFSDVYRQSSLFRSVFISCSICGYTDCVISLCTLMLIFCIIPLCTSRLTDMICSRQNKELVKALSVPARGAKDISFPTKFSQSFWTQIVACLWKTKLTYWRSPEYNCVRYFFTFMTAFIIGSMFWGVGKNT